MKNTDARYRYQLELAVKSASLHMMDNYTANFRHMTTDFDAGYCKGLLDSAKLLLEIFDIQHTEEFLYHSIHSQS